jgi:hypothetical protein
MSQPHQQAVATPPGPAPQPVAGAGAAGSAAAVTGQIGSTTEAATVDRRDTPRLLRSLTTALVLVGVLFGVFGAVSFAGLSYALGRAKADSGQLIRVQNIQTNLLTADATATNTFLVGGLEPAAQRATYDKSIASTGSLIAQASEAQPADAAALSALNQAVVDYASTIEQARANNRQGFPVGAQYLQNASAQLRAEALPVLDNLVAANSGLAAGAMNSHFGLFFEIFGFIALAVLITSMVWVARRFKRTLNTGLVAASALVLVVLIAGLVCLSGVGSDIAALKSGSFSAVNATARARIQANNAKSNESLTLIARGSGATFEKAWAASAANVDASLAQLPRANLNPLWVSYVATHRQIRKLDDGGQWDAAVRLATGAQKQSSNAVFGIFDGAATSYLDSASAKTSTGLAAPQPVLVVFAVLTFLAGIGTALLARWGLTERLKEYR